MFYVLIFSLMALLLVVAFLTVSRRRRNLGSDRVHATYGEGHPTQSAHAAHGTHADAAGRRNRKAKRAQSRHDRRRRH